MFTLLLLCTKHLRSSAGLATLAMGAGTLAIATSLLSIILFDVRTMLSVCLLYYRALWRIFVSNASYDDLR
jgi:hypothetical protein